MISQNQKQILLNVHYPILFPKRKKQKPRQTTRKKKNQDFTDGSQGKVVKENPKDGLIVTLAAKIKNQEERNANLVEEKRVKKDLNILLVVQLLLLAEHAVKARSGARKLQMKA